MTGEMTGGMTGEMTGEMAGEMAGEMTGEMAGEMTGDMTGVYKQSLIVVFTENTIQLQVITYLDYPGPYWSGFGIVVSIDN